MAKTIEYLCERCGEKLNPKTLVGLELNSRKNRFHKPGEVPAKDSQGVFYFGKACAKAVLANDGICQTIGNRIPANSPRRKRKTIFQHIVEGLHG